MFSVQLVLGLGTLVEVWNSLPQDQQDEIISALGIQPKTALLLGLAAVVVGRLVQQEKIRS